MFQRIIVGFAFLYFLSLGVARLEAVQELTGQEVIDRIDRYVAPFVEAGHLSGVVLAARGDEILYHRAFGMANRETGTKFELETPTCVASISKPFTALIALKLIESGKIAPNDPLSKWVEGFPKGDQLLFRHLLGHQSGIPHRLTQADEENVPRTSADMLDLASKATLDFEPGSQVRYSSGGYSVMVRVMELASGKGYEELLNELIVKPLELSQTFHPASKADVSDAAKSYVWTGDGQVLAPEKDYSFLVGAGSMFSTPADVFRFSRAIAKGEFGESTKTRLMRNGRFGWNGITNSYRALLAYDESTDITVALVSNQMTGANDLIRDNIPRILAGESVSTPEIPSPKRVELSEETLKQIEGRYNVAGRPMPIKSRSGVLFANEWVLIPISQTEFFSPQDYRIVSVVFEDEKPIELDWGGMACRRLGPLTEN